MNRLNHIKTWTLALAASMIGFSACNKAPEPATPLAPEVPASSTTIAQLLDSPDSSFTFLKAAVVRAGLLTTLQNTGVRFTVFAPDNDAFIASGIPNRTVINSLPVANVNALVNYHVIPQIIRASSIPTTFPNFQYPVNINPNPAASPFLRLTSFPSRRSNGAWVNNIPITATDIPAANGIVHKVSRLLTPPSMFLWNQISADPRLVLLKAAIDRADQDPTAPGFLANVLGANPNVAIGANFTVFAPDTTAFKNALSFLSGGALNPSMSNATFAGFIGTLPITTVKGIVVYHVLGSRAFSNNLPPTLTNVPTLLNTSISAHPGVGVQATLVTVPGFGLAAASATVKGAANPTAATVTTSDLHYINGTMHIINQVLLPQ